MRAISFDFETFYKTKKPAYGLRTMLPEQYCQDEQFDAYMISVFDGSEKWVGHPKDFNWAAFDGARGIAHNSGFDGRVLKELHVRGLAPAPSFAEVHCTANMSSYLCNRRALADAAEHLLSVKMDKSARADADGKHWPADFSPAEQATMLKYAQQDAITTWELWDKFSPQWPEVERQLSRITIEQGARGVQINTELLDEYILASHEAKSATEKVLPWLRDYDDEDEDDWSAFKVKPTSTKCISEQCRRSGIPCPPVQREDQEGFDEWEATYGKVHPWIGALGAWRSINKLYKTFLTMKSRIRPDGTMPFGLLYFGAHCFTGDHEVLTPEGWVRLDQWAEGEREIMQWKDNMLLFGKAIPNHFTVDTGERLLRLKTGQIDCLVTQGHWMATKDIKTGELRKEQAEDARHKRRKIPISSRFGGATFDRPGWVIKLLVAVQADGHYLPERAIRFRFSRTRKIKRMREILGESNLDWKEMVHPSEPKVTVFVIRQFPEWLGNRKQWTKELLTFSPGDLETLMQELVHWDGHQCGPNSVEYVTTDETNASWISTVAHLTCRAATITKKERTDKGWAAAYRVFIRDAEVTEVRPKNWTDAGPAGEVFCPSSVHGACLFRHNGKIFISYQTGRWSGTAKVNMQNMRRKPVFVGTHGLVEMSDKVTDGFIDFKRANGIYPPEVGRAIDFRALFIPRPGKRMIVSDLAQIEPRVLAWLSGDMELLNMLKSGNSLYQAHAQLTMGYVGAGRMDKTSTLYKLAKARVLALGYGAGWKKFISMAMTHAQLDITADDPEWVIQTDPFTGTEKKVSGYGSTSKRIVKEWRDSNPKIAGEAGIWRMLDENLKRNVGGDFEIELPNGRKLHYEKIRCERRIEPDPETKLPRARSVFTTQVGHKRVMTYGGKLTENVTQAVARDVFGEHIVELDRRGYTNLFSSHDEAILEVDNDVTPADIEQVMSVTPDWLRGCPIAAEAKVVTKYEK